jgi:hypothetical protein
MLSPTRRVATATIAASGSVSAAVDLETESIVAIQMPAAWTTAAITFQGSNDGVTYNDLYDSDGTEVTIASDDAVAARFIVLTAALWQLLKPVRYMKIRSGVTATPVAQAAERAVKLILRQV